MWNWWNRIRVGAAWPALRTLLLVALSFAITYFTLSNRQARWREAALDEALRPGSAPHEALSHLLQIWAGLQAPAPPTGAGAEVAAVKPPRWIDQLLQTLREAGGGGPGPLDQEPSRNQIREQLARGVLRLEPSALGNFFTLGRDEDLVSAFLSDPDAPPVSSREARGLAERLERSDARIGEFRDALRKTWPVWKLILFNGVISWFICMAFVLGAVLVAQQAAALCVEYLAYQRVIRPLLVSRGVVEPFGFIWPRVKRPLGAVRPDEVLNDYRAAGWATRPQDPRLLIELTRDALGTIGRGADFATSRQIIRLGAERAAESLDRRGVLASYAAWVIPSLGFLGTVQGIWDAMTETHSLLRTTGAAQQEAIETVTSLLGYAFTTTFLALLVGIVLMLAMQLLRLGENDCIARVEDQLSALAEATRDYARI